MVSQARGTEGREKEVVSVMKYILDNPVITSIYLHDGAVVADYPCDEKSLQPKTKSSLFKADHQGDKEKLKLTPDNEEFPQLATTTRQCTLGFIAANSLTEE